MSTSVLKQTRTFAQSPAIFLYVMCVVYRFRHGISIIIVSFRYLEVFTDESIMTVMSAYLQAGGYNAMIVDWSNLGFGNYIVVAKTLPTVSNIFFLENSYHHPA